jgi:NAD(P)-dependent dehydrogenase (short-subunit alcohol dehydrogenase family)
MEHEIEHVASLSTTAVRRRLVRQRDRPKWIGRKSESPDKTKIWRRYSLTGVKLWRPVGGKPPFLLQIAATAPMMHAMETPRRIMLLTGASRGIGHATAQQFSGTGWRVITVSRQAFSPKCPWLAGPQDHLQLDLGDIAGLDRGIAEIQSRLPDGRLDALVNNAAISPKGPDGARLGVLNSDAATWLGVFNVNLFAVALMAKGLVHHLSAAKGSIVNVTSIAGSRVHPYAGVAYAASKAALATLTREMAAEFAPLGVRVNAISPGEIDTSLLSPGTAAFADREVPMRRLGRPQEVASAIYFLCSDAASYINGAELHVNGGQHV